LADVSSSYSLSSNSKSTINDDSFSKFILDGSSL
jgi:hypothetical protein